MNSIKILNTFEIVTKISQDKRKQLIRWFARQNFEFQLLAFEKQSNYYFKLKKEGVDKKILSFTSFLLTIAKLYNQEQILKSKNKSQSLDTLGNLSKLEKIKIRKEKLQPKQEMLLNLHSVIENLYLEGFSSRKIQHFLLTRHKKSISHSLISKYINTYIKNSSNKIGDK